MCFKTFLLIVFAGLLTTSHTRAQTPPFEVIVNSTLCDTTWQDSLVLTVTGPGYHQTFQGNTGSIILHVTEGSYTFSAYCPGNVWAINENVYLVEYTEVNMILPCHHFPVRNVYMDPVTAEVVWEQPRIDVLRQDFEMEQFPPSGWPSESSGEGWFRTDDGSGGGWDIPFRDSYYTCVNDLSAGPGNDGSMDYLYMPPFLMDYTDNYVLEFYSFYDGSNGQEARVAFSGDTENWYALQEMEAYPHWKHYSLDLSSFSGPGSEMVWFAFHADDRGQEASGWAIDQVEVFSPGKPAMVMNYSVFLDDSLVGITDTTRFFIDGLVYGQEYEVCVSAHYPSGLSEFVCDSFQSLYLIPPACFYQQYQGDDLITVCPPVDTTGNIPDGFIGYNIYSDNQYLGFLPPAASGFQPSLYTGGALWPGDVYIFQISALYDLTSYGFPGEESESYQLSTTYAAFEGFHLEFLEDWASGSFSSNRWQAEAGSWLVDDQEGHPSPAAMFSGENSQANYSTSLTTTYLRADSLFAGNFLLDFDIKLESLNSTGNEKLKVGVRNSPATYETLYSVSNLDGSFDWTNVSLDISEIAPGSVFQVRFTAEGENSSNIDGWYIDNIHLYRHCYPPVNLETSWEDSCIMLTWEDQGTGCPENAGSPVTAYQVYRSPDNLDYTFLASVDSPRNFYCDDEVRMGFYYKVKSLYTANEDTCISEFSNTGFFNVSIPEEAPAANISIYPIPADNILHVQCNTAIKNIGIMGYTGQSICWFNVDATFKTLDLSGFSNGMYLIRVTTSDGIYTQNIILAK
jgi:hypothetical protein